MFSHGWSIERALTEPISDHKKRLTLNGETKTLDGWCEGLGITKIGMKMRLNSFGWSIEKALTTKSRRRFVVEVNNEELTIDQAAERIGVGVEAIWGRLRRGWDPVEAFTAPKKKSGRPKNEVSP